MPKSIGGILGFAVAGLLTTAVGVFILSRVPMVWNIILKKGA